jgi:hypothetical protein
MAEWHECYRMRSSYRGFLFASIPASNADLHLAGTGQVTDNLNKALPTGEAGMAKVADRTFRRHVSCERTSGLREHLFVDHTLRFPRIERMLRRVAF